MKHFLFALFFIFQTTADNCFCQSGDPNNDQEESDSLKKTDSYKPVELKIKLLDEQFASPISKLVKLRYPPVQDFQTLYNSIDRYKISTDYFEIAYQRIKIIAPNLEGNIFSLVYEYAGKKDTVFAYFKPALKQNGKKVGIQIIPGSGVNQSSAIYYNQKRNYQRNIDDIAQNYGDVFILVKPNEDFLAIHNGNKKISEVSFVNYLLNHGSSYSAYYLIQSLAISKFIKFEYEEYYVCGLSQGGAAALINALQSRPQKALIASGFSVLLDHPHMSGQSQLIIPGCSNIYNSEGIRNQIQDSETNFLFTWGEKETSEYGMEAKGRMSALFFEQLKNVKTFIHPKGHVYFEPAIKDFFENTALSLEATKNKSSR